MDLLRRTNEPTLMRPANSHSWPNGHANGFARDRLRIAVVAPPWFTVPPRGYGGTERVAALLTEGLAARGHDVTLFAPRGSQTGACLEETVTRAMRPYLGSVAIETLNVLLTYPACQGFDVIHDHTVAGLAASPFVRGPVVHTVHGVVSADAAELYASLPANVHLVAISRHQQRTLPAGVPSSLIYNAIDLSGVGWSDRQGDYLLFVGRAAPEKGPLEALRIAERAGMPIRMILKVNERPEQEYFEVLRPYFSRPTVQVDIEPSEAEKVRAYQGAYATLFPICWDEPFGLVMIESMASGTPVIGFRRGSVPEVVDDGVTGFVCGSIDEAVASVPNVVLLGREACRRRVETMFAADVAVARHEALYASLARVGGRAGAD